MTFKPCIVIPVFNHGRQIAVTLEGILRHGLPVLLVDDGSDDFTRDALVQLEARHRPQVSLLRLQQNSGKGAAVMAGLRAAHRKGYTHALQIDADGQHDPDDIPRFAEQAQAAPEAVILGCPVYDDTVPRARFYGRYATHVWVWIETLSFDIRDSMCGFRLYPLASSCALIDRVKIGTRMDFDTEILVRLHWRGVRMVSIPTRVTYARDGVSHFDVWRDNVRISAMHARLFIGMLMRLPMLLARRFRACTPTVAWWRASERGSALGMRTLALSCRWFGVRFTSLLLYPIVAYFCLTSRAARDASAGYLSRLARTSGDMHVPKAGWLTSFRHLLSFARSGLDKLAAWSGQIPRRAIEIEGREAYEEAIANGQGALIVGAHLGNLEMIRALATLNANARITAVVHTSNARRFNTTLKGANATFHRGMLEIGDIGPDTAILLKQRIDAGEMLVIVGDRVPVGDSNRTVEAPFLGEPARFAQGPYLLAHLLKCPVYLMFCLREGERHRVYFERFATRITLPRAEREQAIAGHAMRYAERLEHFCRKAPLQWFNFFDFWQRPGIASKAKEAFTDE